MGHVHLGRPATTDDTAGRWRPAGREAWPGWPRRRKRAGSRARCSRPPWRRRSRRRRCWPPPSGGRPTAWSRRCAVGRGDALRLPAGGHRQGQPGARAGLGTRREQRQEALLVVQASRVSTMTSVSPSGSKTTPRALPDVRTRSRPGPPGARARRRRRRRPVAAKGFTESTSAPILASTGAAPPTPTRTSSRARP